MITVDREALKGLIREVLGELVGDRREVPRLKNGHKRPKKFCPVKGCRNPFAPRYQGFCSKHRDMSAADKKKAKEAAAKK